MTKKLDYFLCIALILFSAGHGVLGTLMSVGWQTPEAVWSFSGSIAAWLVAAMNILRIRRPSDVLIIVLALAGNLAWVGLMIWLGVVADMFLDVRLWLFIVTATGLAVFSVSYLSNKATKTA